MKSITTAQTKVLAAYFLWGILPLFWKLFAAAPPSQVLFHRTLWAAVWLGMVLASRGALRDTLSRVARERRHLVVAGVAALLLATNWFTYLVAIFRNELQEASLGYYLCPLFTIALGWAVLGERLNFVQKAALATVAAGVLLKVFAQETMPWYALILALSFSLYSLVRKNQLWGAEAGLLVETVLLLPIVTMVMVAMAGTDFSVNKTWLHQDFVNVRGFAPLDPSHCGKLRLLCPDPLLFLGNSIGELALLMAAGLVTAVPLVLLVSGAKGCSLRFVGAAQYIAPTVSLAISWLAFGEPLHPGDAVSFLIVWVGLGILIGERLIGRWLDLAVEGWRRRVSLPVK